MRKKFGLRNQFRNNSQIRFDIFSLSTHQIQNGTKKE